MPVRPLAAAPASAPTEVVSYEEVRHTVEPADTFQSLSKDFYNSDAYARALQMWNQTHPRANDAMARDGTLVPGQKIFIPPAAQLEQHYAALIPNLKAVARPASGAMQTAYTAPAAAAPFAYYKVVQDESPEVIARQTLGSGDRANELLRLNPNLRTGTIVPAGTLLLLPAGATVPPENGAPR
jgi:hypothetical protein